MTPRVYVVQSDGKRDLSAAEMFGTLETVLRTNIYPDYSNTDLRRISEQVKTNLRDFKADSDFLLLIGDPANIAMCCAWLAQLVGPEFRVLKWDNILKEYYPITINFR